MLLSSGLRRCKHPNDSQSSLARAVRPPLTLPSYCFSSSFNWHTFFLQLPLLKFLPPHSREMPFLKVTSEILRANSNSLFSALDLCCILHCCLMLEMLSSPGSPLEAAFLDDLLSPWQYQLCCLFLLWLPWRFRSKSLYLLSLHFLLKTVSILIVLVSPQKILKSLSPIPSSFLNSDDTFLTGRVLL